MATEIIDGPDGPIRVETSGEVWYPEPRRGDGPVGHQRRSRSTDLHVRPARRTGKARVIYGYAAVFNEWATIADGPGLIHREIIAPGAFRAALAERQDVECRYEHDTSHVLGETRLGTLRIREDDRGLYFECDVPDTELGRAVVREIERGELSGASFQYLPRAGGETKRTSSLGGRTLIESTITAADLFDVSVVWNPAYRGTSAKVRSSALAGRRAAEPAERRRADWEAKKLRMRAKLRELQATSAGWSPAPPSGKPEGAAWGG